MANTIKYTLTVFILTAASAVMAQKDKKAEPFLEKISTELNEEKTLSISFDYTREDQQAESIVEGDGTLVIQGEKYRIELGEAIVFFDGTKQYSLQKEIEEVYITTPDPDNKEFMFSDPITLLRSYKEKFKYRLMGVNEIYGMKAHEVQLYPEELGGPYALLKLYFDLENDDLKAIVIRHKEGVLYSMIITELQPIDPPGDNYFRFNQADYPNAEVIELMN